jgi:hypothetical protein
MNRKLTEQRDHVISLHVALRLSPEARGLRAVIETEFEKVDGANNLCTAIVNSISTRCQRCIEKNDKLLNNCCDTAPLNTFL